MEIKCGADFADWYDTDARKFTDEVLTEFVDANPNFLGVYVASAAANGFDLGSFFFVDVARIGTGAASGTGSGFFQDILRALSVLPIGKVANVGKPLVGGFLQKVTNFFHWSKQVGKTCVPISVGQALQATGQFLFIRLDDIVKAMGRQMSSFDNATGVGSNTDELRAVLTTLKAHFDELPAGVAQGWDDIVMYAKNTEGVLLVSVKKATGQGGNHRIMVSNTVQGVKIIDRAGTFKSLEELSRHYRNAIGGDLFVLNKSNPLVIVKNWVLDPALAFRLNAMGPLGAIAVRAAMIIGFNPNVPSNTIKDAFRQHVAGRNPASLYPEPVRPPQMDSLMFTHTVAGPRIHEQDWLSNIAKKWYGDVLLWPILFDYNRGPDFQDPNKMYVGQRVKVPFITDKTAADIAFYRNRGRTWR